MQRRHISQEKPFDAQGRIVSALMFLNNRGDSECSHSELRACSEGYDVSKHNRGALSVLIRNNTHTVRALMLLGRTLGLGMFSFGTPSTQ